jgi:coenzyme F420 biosynthesis associated uncharacterized protein
VIDWSLAQRTASATLSLSRGQGVNSAYTPEAIERAAAEAVAAVSAYAGLGTPAAPPRGELIGRREWTRNALVMLRDAAASVERRLAADVDAPGPLGPALRRAAGAGLGIEIGIAAGYAGGRVLGQLDIALFGAPRPARLLFVDENLERARVALDARSETFLRWVALHEATHVVQFGCVAWLEDHVRGLARELIDGAVAELDAGSLGRLGRELLRSPRELVRALLRGELARLLSDDERRAQLDRLQATMSVIEGHAEHVMDAVAADLGEDLTELRKRLDQRRSRRGGLGELIGRLLGIEAKLRQYEQGKAFCDSVAEVAGPEGLLVLWEAPERLPSLPEVEQPRRWLDRTGIALSSGV